MDKDKNKAEEKHGDHVSDSNHDKDDNALYNRYGTRLPGKHGESTKGAKGYITQQLKKIMGKATHKAKERQRKEIEEINNNPDVSIFDVPEFPHSVQRFAFSPNDVHKALLLYEATNKNITECLSCCGVDVAAWYKVLRDYPEVDQRYELARSRKADIYQAESISVFLPEKPPEWAKDIDIRGGEKWSNAAIQYLYRKSEMWHRQAVIHNRPKYGEITQLQSKSINLNLNANLGEIDKISNNLDDLLNG